MVLGLRLSAPAAGLLTALLLGCSAGEAEQGPLAPPQTAATTMPDERLMQARVGGRDLELVNEAGQCALRTTGAAVPLGFAAPCGFLRPKAGAPAWTHDYGARGAVVLVGGPPATSGEADTGRIAADRCSDIGRAVVVTGGKVALSEIKRSRGWFCPDSAPDEKYYYGIAHDSETRRTPVG